ncbi:MAG: hypothetical protein IH627_19800 [Rubrivivax sp.]|nr:hypothetical protein [Rubrivivax sp.]
MKMLRSLLCTAGLVWLAACGPGTGGTGSGESYSPYLSTFGASASSVCASAFGSALSCADTPAGGVDTAAAGSTAGTAMAHFTDGAAGGEVHLAIEGNTAHLEGRCQGLRFDGEWGTAEANDARFFGAYTTALVPTPVPATLAIEAGPPGQGGALQVTLRQADGRVLLGPVVLLHVPRPITEPAVCR